MKKLIFFLAFIAGYFITAAQTVTASPENLKKLNWLTGTWNRLDMKPNRSGSERWEKISPTEWQGWGVSMKSKDTSFVEKLRIIAKDNLIFYVADVKGNKDIVYFQFVSLSEDHFVCENPAHDFPKRIEYKLRGNQLQASISGDGRTIPFLFERMNP
ncbi:DUF6265 family protein [Pseudobacter ginsenosidimutans]|uniref:DUF6265 domain-containing protein n=1 Tax=Pseudobacter ginsenosidimutans TaxID=661488 RepID=A0A4Q7MTQ0_9BACT|nr:DUF6265 family protein [Pseudobacter ginsenosidimutans]QEC41011.1 hypothetical protein FSB84_04620 [Pseudobacter ginsenosidimutans]RZS72242.1 hypothetical protein EV199_4158 [Pseudobacter ginsenosidimutans]